jgi:uncharacterized repeat protein (TIGR02543 family)
VNRPTKRSALTVFIALAFACGGSSPPPGSVGGRQTVLRVTTIGEGLVRGAGDDCRGTCSTLTPIGNPLRLQAVPDPGVTFAGWTGACNGTGACQLAMAGETAVTANFKRDPPLPGFHHLTVIADGSGRVISTPAGLDCNSTTCSSDFTDGAIVTLNATPATGFVFDGWTVGPCAGTAGCAVTMRDDAQVTAKFSPHLATEIHISVAVSGPGQVMGGAIDCGLPPSAVCDATVPPASTTTLTAFPAARTRFLGWGGACTGAEPTCPVVANADTQVTAAFEFEMDTLVPNDGTNMSVLAINSTHAFFGRRNADGSSAVWSVPKTGGSPSLVAPGVPQYLVADDGFVYWHDGFALYSAPVAGGPASQLATSPAFGRLALDSRGALYWVDVAAPDRKGKVHRMENRIDVPIASDQDPIGGIAVDSGFAYFSDAGAPGTGGAIKRVPRTGGPVETVANTPAEVVALRLDPDNVYFRDTTGAVFAMARSGGAARLLSGPNTGAVTGPLDLDANASVVWWTWMDTTNGASKGLFHANADGTDFTALETGSDLTVWSGPRVDDTAAFYFHAGALLKRLK